MKMQLNDNGDLDMENFRKQMSRAVEGKGTYQ